MGVSSLIETTLSDSSLERTITAFAKQLYLDGDLIMVAQRNNRIIGVIIGKIRDQQGICYRIIVDENCQNKGIERALTGSLVHRFRKLNVRSIGIFLDDDSNTETMELFLSLGFTRAEFVTKIG
jgi:ribosomal protein S18 acetylase RimI-like enzyme